MCEHKYVYGGVKYEVGWQRSGSSAHEVLYYDWWFCEKCLEKKYERLSFTNTTYDQVAFNATPKGKE